MKILLPFVAVLVTGACSKGTRVESAATTPAVASEAKDFASAWGAVASGRTNSTRAEGLTVEKKDDAIVVTREIQRVAGLEEPSGDASEVIGRVKSRLAHDAKVDASFVEMNLDQGDLVMRGHVTSADEAGAIVHEALATPGVDRVIAHLTWWL